MEVKENLSLGQAFLIPGIPELIIALGMKNFYDMILLENGELTTEGTTILEQGAFIFGAVMSNILTACLSEFVFYSRRFIVIAMCNVLFLIAHTVILGTGIYASCPGRDVSPECVAFIAFKGWATVGVFFMYSYLAPINLAMRACYMRKKVVIGTAMGLVLGGSRLLRILVFDESVWMIVKYKELSHIISVVVLFLVSWVLRKHIISDFKYWNYRRKSNNFVKLNKNTPPLMNKGSLGATERRSNSLKTKPIR